MHARGRHAAGASANLAAALPLAGLVIALLLAHAPPGVVAKYLVFLIFGVTLPGLVIWRGIGRYRRNLIEDLGAAFAVGTAAQLIVYLASASVGLQKWSWVWAIPVLLVGLLDRDIRYACWSRVHEPVRPVTAWLFSAATALVLLAVFQHGPAAFAPPYTAPNAFYPDMPFHHALGVSAKYDVPLTALWVSGGAMRYHSFFHQIMAATSWATGIDLAHLIYTIGWLPLMLAGCALTFALADRFVRRSGWAGPLAVLAAGIGGTIQPLSEIGLASLSTATVAYLSPTQNLGGMYAVLLAMIAVDLLRRERNAGRWVLLFGVALAASGAKATVLPLVVCGFGLAWLTALAIGRRDRTALIGAVAMVLLFVGSVVAIFAGQSSGLEFRLGEAFARMPPYPSLRQTTGPDVDGHAQLVTTVVTLLGWAVAGFGLLFVRRLWKDPGIGFLAGMSIGGLVAMLVTSQPGISQMYFLRTAFPAIAVLTCVGLAQLVQRIGDRRAIVVAGAGAGLGTLACVIALVATSSASRTDVTTPWMYAGVALLLSALVVTVVWKSMQRPGRVTTVFATALAAAGVVAACIIPVQSIATTQGVAGELFGKPNRGGPSTAQADAARWIRDHSDTEDLVATNAHCLVKTTTDCDTRHFWIAALSERQVLVEGWAYTNRINAEAARMHTNPNLLPFWDQTLIDVNDQVFAQPNETVVGKLRNELKVRWLYADVASGGLSPDLQNFATIRFRNEAAIVYELTR
ncbi:hypothetical protein OG394_23355 [Kribbella sp. NBC_01245]|uniref:hypothetical protein n=1 Tax=Kribbella sp. NBC_01245 TaxID=2903578 RepID=UPI002E2D1E13|nr:hypothetical protein [Kribbella sp. NBC_01245]